MAKATQNTAANVSAGKGVSGGYIFVAPTGTTLPTDYTTALDKAFLNLGFISEDGYAETIEEDTDDLVDMNGDVMDSTNSNRVESATLSLAEIKEDALKVMYGEDNVEDKNGMITVKHNSNSHGTFSYVLELVLKNGRKWRKVIPQGKTTELGDMTIASSELCAREMTIKYLIDEAGNSSYDYIQSTETTASA